ncbi:hypothetical protein M0R45_017824 [Rubus argutus]|uniref:RIN4 pathogenic type III effector avirulence factor Avr cleavage site domain-containing protein n=1 Tax=Rubus argutus TaxID=59490 RepID=A0AAW1XZ47_RUBAR
MDDNRLGAPSCTRFFSTVVVRLGSVISATPFNQSEKGRPLPKFGEWDVNDPASAEGFTVIFNKARDEKKTGGKPESPSKADHNNVRPGVDPGRPPSKKWFCCIAQPPTES